MYLIRQGTRLEEILIITDVQAKKTCKYHLNHPKPKLPIAGSKTFERNFAKSNFPS
jgi:hypothetical protein